VGFERFFLHPKVTSSGKLGGYRTAPEASVVPFFSPRPSFPIFFLAWTYSGTVDHLPTIFQLFLLYWQSGVRLSILIPPTLRQNGASSSENKLFSPLPKN